MRYHWEHELLKWLGKGTITKNDVVVVSKSKQDLNRSTTKVVIISYELVSRSVVYRHVSMRKSLNLPYELTFMLCLIR